MRTIVVVGASLAGLRAVETARRLGYDGRLVLVGAEPGLPYDRPPLSKAFLTEADTEIAPFRGRSHYTELGVELRLGIPATTLDTAHREVGLADGERLGFDGLILATGAKPRALPGTCDQAGIHVLRTADDAIALRGAMRRSRRIVVIGSGFIGSEIASSAGKNGLEVTMVEALPTPLAGAIGGKMGEICSLLHTDNGTRLRCGIGVTGVDMGNGGKRVRLADGGEIDADLVVAGIGVSPATEWLVGSGLAIDDGIVCDEMLCAGVPGIYAAGDVARWPNSLFGQSMRLEHWTSAAEQGAHAMRNLLAGGPGKPYTAVPYFWSDWYDSRIQFLGIVGEEVRVVHGSADERRLIAVYRRGNRIVGALSLNWPTAIMKYRALIARRATWPEALAFEQVVA
ncbi:NAD(P)/FAD-dependent oxidoreductase [Saccharopolyspora shandongensis]|uniref:NAD(P)/FAD-dependent oxidoreductase n=1 Tax=Saccharopolyspora shandongensis TaxID=418495 RepID=UPI003405AE06